MCSEARGSDKYLEALNIDELEALLLALVDVLLISNHENLDALLGGVGKNDRTSEALVTGGIVVLKTDLELNGLSELTLLGLRGVFQDGLDGLQKTILVKLAHSDLLRSGKRSSETLTTRNQEEHFSGERGGRKREEGRGAGIYRKFFFMQHWGASTAVRYYCYIFFSPVAAIAILIL